MLLCDVCARTKLRQYTPRAYTRMCPQRYPRAMQWSVQIFLRSTLICVTLSLTAYACFGCQNCFQVLKKCTKLTQTVRTQLSVCRYLLWTAIRALINRYCLLIPAHAKSLSRFVCIRANDEIGRVEVGDRFVQFWYVPPSRPNLPTNSRSSHATRKLWRSQSSEICQAKSPYFMKIICEENTLLMTNPVSQG